MPLALLALAAVAAALAFAAGRRRANGAAPAGALPPGTEAPSAGEVIIGEVTVGPAVPGLPVPYTIRSGDTGVGIARRFTGDPNRWREIVQANPQLRVVQRTIRGVRTTLIEPWNVGQQILIPATWRGAACALLGPEVPALTVTQCVQALNTRDSATILNMAGILRAMGQGAAADALAGVAAAGG